MIDSGGHEFSGKTLLATIHSGYVGTPEKWLAYFESVVLDFGYEQVDNCVSLAREVFQYCQYEPLIKHAEVRLGVSLPKSYKDFVLAGGIEFFNCLVNKFYYYNNEPHDDVFFDIHKVGRLKDVDESRYLKLFNGYEDSGIQDKVYYHYDCYEKGSYTAADTFIFKLSHTNFINFGLWPTCSGLDTYGLVDKELTQDGEYEAWIYNPRLPGAARFRSFAELCIFCIIGSLLSIDSERYIEESDIFKFPSTALILDTTILREQWKPQ